MSTSRREFLRGSALAGLGLYFARDGWAAPRSPSDKLNIAAIGIGGRGAGDLDEVAKLGENIVALCDVNRTTLGNQGKRFPKATQYTDFRRLFDTERNLDAVVCGAPDHVHALVSGMALVRGLHSYCEKPLTHTPYEARFLAELARGKGLATQMGNQGHANNGLREAVEVMRAGTLGRISQVHVWTDRPVGWWPQGVRRPVDKPTVPADLDWDSFLGPAPWRPYHPAYQPFVWRGWWDFGTGAIGDIACHMADPAFWGLNLGDPVRVESETDGTGTPDSPPLHSRTHYIFADGCVLTWHDGKLKPDADLFCGAPIPDNGSLVVGANGTLLMDGTAAYRLLPDKQWTGFKPPAPSLPRSPGHHAEWIRAAKGGEMCQCPFTYAGHMTEVVLLGNISIRGGQPVEWDADLMRVTNNPDAQQYVTKTYRPGWDLHELTGVKPLFGHVPVNRHREG
ncbi:MAG: Gfo/Idh/MocA family oxidoreductase [Armatimonadetes bacterium]|nr:Gfo/Idh/MocA family oxidoreductase [Armatimonadota bacterium]